MVMRLYNRPMAPYTKGLYRCYPKGKGITLVDDSNCDGAAGGKVILGYASMVSLGQIKHPIYRVSHATRGDLIMLSKKSYNALVANKAGGWKDRGVLGYTQ